MNLAGRYIGSRAQEIYLGFYPYAEQPLVRPGEKGGTSEHFRRFWNDESINQPKWQKQAMSQLRGTPLPPHIREIQRNYWITRYDLGQMPDWLRGPALQGAKEFRGATTVGEMMDAISNAHRQIIGQMPIQRTFGDPQKSVTDAWLSIATDALPTYSPSRTGRGNIAQNLTAYIGQRMFAWLQNTGRVDRAALPPGIFSTEMMYEYETMEGPENIFQRLVKRMGPDPNFSFAELTPEQKIAEINRQVFQSMPKTVPSNLTDFGLFENKEVLFLTGNASPRQVKSNPLYAVLMPQNLLLRGIEPFSRNDPFFRERSAAQSTWNQFQTAILARPQISGTFGPGTADVEYYTREAEAARNPDALYMHGMEFEWESTNRGYKRGIGTAFASLEPVRKVKGTTDVFGIGQPVYDDPSAGGTLLRNREGKWVASKEPLYPFTPIEFDTGQRMWTLDDELAAQDEARRIVQKTTGIYPLQDVVTRTVNTSASYAAQLRDNPVARFLYNLGMRMAYPDWNQRTGTQNPITMDQPQAPRFMGELPMNYQFQGRQRLGVYSDTTFDAIIAGERTATTRFGQHAAGLHALRRGDVVAFTSGNRLIYARITNEATTVGGANMVPGQLEQWSQLEGWSTEYGQEIFAKKGIGTQIQYEYLPDYIPPNQQGAPITSFRGEHSFLSNFAATPVTFEGETYPTAEHAFQAAKTTDQAIRQEIRRMRSPSQAKTFGKTIDLRSDWFDVRVNVMEDILRSKFSTPEMEAALASTGDVDLIEGNYWMDQYWGVSRGKGENMLGQLLVKVREDVHKKLGTYVSVTPDERIARAHFKQREFVSARLDPYSEENLGGYLSEKMAFQIGTKYESKGRGTARGTIGYLRATDPSGNPFVYLTESEMRKKWNGLEFMQKSYMNEKLAGFHEIGHVVYREMGAKAQGKFLEAYNARLKRMGKEGMLAADWPEGKFNPREEFAQAYAIAAGMGGEILGEEATEYAMFFADNADLIESAEDVATLVTHMGEPAVYKPKIKEHAHLGDISAEYQPGYPESRQGRKFRAFENLRSYLSEYEEYGPMQPGRLTRRERYEQIKQGLAEAASLGGGRIIDAPRRSNIAEVRAIQDVALIEGYEIEGDITHRPEQTFPIDDEGHWITEPPRYTARRITHVGRKETYRRARAQEERVSGLRQEAQQREDARTISRVWREQNVDDNISTRLQTISGAATFGKEGPTRVQTSGGAQYDPGSGAVMDELGTKQVMGQRDFDVARIRSIEAINMATSTPTIGVDNQNIVATLVSRVNKRIHEVYNEALKADLTPEQRQIVQTQKELSLAMGKAAVREAAKAAGIGSRDIGAGIRQGTGAYARQLTAAEAADMLPPAALDAIARSGQSPESLARGATPYVFSSKTGEPVQLGGPPIYDGGPPGGGAMGRGRGNLFGGTAGSIMYAMYIGKRMMGMTIEPEIQSMQQYGGYLSSFAALQGVTDPSVPLVSTPAGFASRQAAVQRYMQQGAYEQWGGFTNVAYSLTGGGGTGPRALSGLKVALGIGVGGALLGQTLGMTGAMAGGMASGMAATAPGVAAGLASVSGTLGAIGSAVGAVATPVAVALGSGVLGMEALNAGYADKAINWINERTGWNLNTSQDFSTPMSFGMMAQDAGNALNYYRAQQRAGGSGFLQSPLGRGIVMGMGREDPRVEQAGGFWSAMLGKKKGTLPKEEVLAAMTPQERAMYDYSGVIPENVQKIMDQLEAAEVITGEEGAAIAGQVLPGYVAATGKVPTNLADLANQWRGMGIGLGAGLQSTMQQAEMLGYLPGTEAYGAYAERFNAITDVTERAREISRASRVSQFAGQIAGYMGSSSRAQRLTAAAGLTTQAEMTPVQGLMGAFSQAGFGMDTTAAYALQTATRYGPRPDGTYGPIGSEDIQVPVPLDVAITAQAKVRGGFLTNYVDRPVVQSALARGAGIEALGYGPTFGFTNQFQAQAYEGWLGTANQYGFGYGQQIGDIARAVPSVSAYASQAIPSMAGPLLRAGYGNAMEVLAQGMGQNLTDTQIALVGQGVGGDLGAMSYMAANEPQLLQNPQAWQFYNAANQPIYSTNMPAFMDLARSRAGQVTNAGLIAPGTGLATGLMNLTGLPAGATATQQIGAFMEGTGADAEAIQAWASGGLQGRTDLHRQRMADYQRQSAGIQMAGVALARRMLWGGGDWQNPTEDSIWGIQDRQRALAHRQQMYQFGFQREMMETQNQFAIQQESIQASRMEIGQAYQRFNLGWQEQMTGMRRVWARDDWQFQDQMRGMQYGWQMEDIDEAIRTTTGRQRAQLVRRKERMATQYNVEGQQIDTQRDRQEEMWAREDERFEKQKSYAEAMMELDEEQFELQQTQRETMFQMQSDHLEKQIEFYKENKKLQDEMIAKQREYQVEQLNLQAAAAALQAKQAEEQLSYNNEVDRTKTLFDLIEDSTGQIVKYKPEETFKAFSEMVIDVTKLTQAQAYEIGKVFEKMKDVDWNNISGLQRLFLQIDTLDPEKVNKYTSALLGLEAEINDIFD